MLRQTCAAAFAALTAFASFTLATAQEPKETAAKKQIANSIGVKLVLIPAGEFMMGGEEKPEDVVAFFKKTYGWDNLNANDYKSEHPAHRVQITRPFYLGARDVTVGQFRKFTDERSTSPTRRTILRRSRPRRSRPRRTAGSPAKNRNPPGGIPASSRPTTIPSFA